MTYPKRAEIYDLLMNGGYGPVMNRYRLTMAEVTEIDKNDEVSLFTAKWAEDLRARCPKAFPHVD